MATLITNNTAGNILIQTGVGTPNHVAPKGSQFTDITTANLYINKDGIINWVLNIDASNSGATSNIYSFNTFSSTTVGQTFVSTSIANDTITLSGIGLNIITDDTNNILTFSSSTDTDTYITGGTYNPTNGIISFTNNLGGGFNVTGITDNYWTSGSTGNYSIKAKNDSGLDATGNYAVAEGEGTLASGISSHAEGGTTISSGQYSHAEGSYSLASGNQSHAEGFSTSATGITAHAEGNYTIAGGNYSHAEGNFTKAYGNQSHAEGNYTIASGNSSHAEGNYTIANGNSSHAEGESTIASGDYSHAGGDNSVASGTTSFVHSSNSFTNSDYSAILGGYNNIIPYGIINSIILGGDSITATTSGTTFVEGLNIKNTQNDNSITKLLTVDNTGLVKYRDASSIIVSDTYVTGGTYNGGTATFTNNTGGTFNVNGFYTGATDVYVTGLTFNPSNYDLTISRNDNVSFTESLAILSSDMVVTGGTYNPSTGIATFTNNSGGTFNVNGFLTGMTDTYVTGLTYSNNLITLKQNGGQPNLSILIDNMSGLTINGALSATTYYNLPTDIRVTGGTYSNGTTIFTNNTGGTFNVTGYYTGATDVYITGATYSNNVFTYRNNTGGTFNVSFNSVTGLTVDGVLSATTISGDTIYANNFPQLPLIDNETIDYYIASGDTFIRLKESVAAPSGGTRTFVGNMVVGSGFSANTISATTYYNLPTDIYTTGGTYSNGTIVFTNNTGGTFNVTGLSTGNTDTFITGGTYSNGTTTFRNNTGGTFNVGGYYTGSTDVFVTGGTYNSSNNTFTYTNNTGGTFNVSFNQVTGLTATTLSVDYIDFNTATTSTLQVGRLQWNDADEIGGLEVMMKGGNVSYQLGEENLARVYNADSVPLTAGTIVYVYGSQGNTISVKRASASGETTSAKVLGVVDELIPVGGRGFVNTFGLVRDLNTASYSGGNALWLGVEAGTFTNVKPNAPYHNVLIGFVSRVHATTGSIFIHISNGWELDELHDVISTGVTFGDILSYSGYNGYNVWTSTKTLNGSYTITGNTTIGGTMQAATISATTYQNLPTDIRVTGGTYSSGTATFTNNTGGTFNVTGFYTSGSGSGDFLPLSGGTVTGSTTFTNGLTANTISATTYQNLPDAELDTKIFGYRVNSATQKAYKMTQTIAGSTMATGTINGESIYCQKFYAYPNEKINEIVFRIMTAGASGLGLAQARILIYRSKLNANNEIIGGDLELDTNVNISTLSTGLKVVTGLNHTLSNNTYKNVWFMCIRNYQSGSLSLKFYTTTDIVSKLYDISSSSTTAERDLGWYFSCLYTSATPASMPVSASTSPSTTAVASTSGLVAIGYSNY